MVPVESVVVVRGGKRVTPLLNKPFDFTDSEVRSLREQRPEAIREPVNEGHADSQTAAPDAAGRVLEGGAGEGDEQQDGLGEGEEDGDEGGDGKSDDQIEAENARAAREAKEAKVTKKVAKAAGVKAADLRPPPSKVDDL